MINKGRLFLIPVPVAAETHELVVTPQVRGCLPGIRHFLAEDVRTARRFLSSLKIYDSIASLSFSVLNKDTLPADVEISMEPVLAGYDVGVLSESGCPGIADPGAMAVAYAHQIGVRVIPLVGPSSIVLSLMASGLNGQRFAFHGYLPIQAKDAARELRELEKESRQKNQTQIFIETPYRNNSLLANLTKYLEPGTRLCVAADVTGQNEWIQTQPIREWRAKTVDLRKDPTVFLFLA